MYLERDAELFISKVKTGFNASNTIKLNFLSGISISPSNTFSRTKVPAVYQNINRNVRQALELAGEVSLSFSTYLDLDTPSLSYLWEGLLGASTLFPLTEYSITDTVSLPKFYVYLKYGSYFMELSNTVVESCSITYTKNSIIKVSWKLLSNKIEETLNGPITFSYYQPTHKKLLVLKVENQEVPTTDFTFSITNTLEPIKRKKLGEVGSCAEILVSNTTTKFDFQAYLRNSYIKGIFESYTNSSENINEQKNYKVYIEDELFLNFNNVIVFIPSINIDYISTISISGVCKNIAY